MAQSISDFLGHGLYTVAEAAYYARVPTPLMSRWLFGTKVGQSVLDPQFGRQEKRVSFLDLIQTLAIREIRLQHKVPLPKFREAIAFARKSLKLDYPFARQHCTYLYGDKLVIRPKPDIQEFIEASGKHRGQRLLSFVEMYLKDLSFNADGLAREFLIYQSRDEVKITMNPQKRFGEPLLPSGYTPFAIWQAIRVEGGLREAARAYGLSVEEVDAAYDFVANHLGKSAA